MSRASPVGSKRDTQLVLSSTPSAKLMRISGDATSYALSYHDLYQLEPALKASLNSIRHWCMRFEGHNPSKGVDLEGAISLQTQNHHLVNQESANACLELECALVLSLLLEMLLELFQAGDELGLTGPVILAEQVALLATHNLHLGVLHGVDVNSHARLLIMLKQIDTAKTT
eukprot:1796690-Pyramimonas_sp.AAC.3